MDGRTALVTGGSRGIGRAIALGLAEDGAAAVAITYRTDEEAAAETVAALQALGAEAHAYRADGSVLADLDVASEAALADLGPVDVLVNNAGIASRGQTVVDTDPAEQERLLRVHALGPARLCQHLVPAMRDRSRGDVIMISSAATRYMAANGSPYNMAKAAMEALAFTLAKEERRFGIHVNVVAPGLVDTEMGRRLVKATAGVDDIHALAGSMPFGRVCAPEDVADVVRYLVSDRATYVTGEKLTVHGGGQ
jgi:NAD(P)-dependent dehydrogenase (short-subunit alcohol dehydrogenase family)